MDVKQTFPGIETNIGMSDILFMPYGNYMAMQGIVAGFTKTLAGNRNARINGCLFSENGTTTSVTAGYMLMNNTCVKVEAQTIDFDPLLYTYIRIQVNSNPIGRKVYNDGVERETCLEIRGILFQSATNYTNNLNYYTVWKPILGFQINNTTIQDNIVGRNHTYTSFWNLETTANNVIDISNLEGFAFIKSVQVILTTNSFTNGKQFFLPFVNPSTNLVAAWLKEIDLTARTITLEADTAIFVGGGWNLTCNVFVTYF